MIPTLLFCLSISFTHLEGNNKTGKTKAAAFSNYDNKASKYIFAFLRVSFFIHPLSCPLSLFYAPYLKAIIKQATLKPPAFFDHGKNAIEIFYSFSVPISLSTTQSYVLSLMLPTHRK